MAQRVYGQYCGFSRALELVGERWALLIVRDLLVGPKRFSDLLRGLPGIPTNILTARLKELEEAGIVRRQAQARPSRGIAYELTQDGEGLNDTVIAIGKWGAKRLGTPRPGEVVTADSLATALRTTFQPSAAKGVTHSFEVRVGPHVVHAVVSQRKVRVGVGPLPKADVTIEATSALRELLAAEITPTAALRSGSVHLTGDPKLLTLFAQLFRI